jgi:hypothetical protein
MSTLKNWLSFLALLLIFMLIGTSVNTYADSLSAETVKLYSDGKVVGQWESSHKGGMEGPCYVFKVKKGAYSPEVRVCGTFSVEEKR